MLELSILNHVPAQVCFMYAAIPVPAFVISRAVGLFVTSFCAIVRVLFTVSATVIVCQLSNACCNVEALAFN